MEPIKLSSLLIYNSSYGPREGEEEKKLLYYFPDSEKLHKKINNVGLCEALVQFSRSMSPGMPCECLHTQRHHYLFYEPEDAFWMVMSLANPIISHNGKIEIKEHEINDSVYQSILKELYNRFKFLHGTFVHISHLFDVNGLKEKLNIFLNEYIASLNLANCDLLDIFNGISYCSLKKSTILAFHSFVSSLQDKFKYVKYSLIMNDHNLILSGLCNEDTQILVKLLREKLCLNLPFSKRFKMASLNAHLTIYQLNHGRFLNNIFVDASNTVFINVKGERMEQMHMLVYQAFSITSCYFLDYLDGSSIDTCKKLDSFVGPQLISLAREIPGTQPSPNDGLEPHIKHIYFNHHSLAAESTCHSLQGGVFRSAIPKEVIHVLNDINGGIAASGCQDEEIINKVDSEYWVTAKKRNQQELYAVVNNKNANLIGVNEDVRKLSSHFDNLYFSD